jgi:hypothetical protein
VTRRPPGGHALPLVPLPGQLRQVLVQVQAGEVRVLSVAGASRDCARPPLDLQAAAGLRESFLLGGACRYDLRGPSFRGRSNCGGYVGGVGPGSEATKQKPSKHCARE